MSLRGAIYNPNQSNISVVCGQILQLTYFGNMEVPEGNSSFPFHIHGRDDDDDDNDDGDDDDDGNDDMSTMTLMTLMMPMTIMKKRLDLAASGLRLSGP